MYWRIILVLVFFIVAPIHATAPMLDEKRYTVPPVMPSPPPYPPEDTLETAYIVAKINEDGYAAILSTYSIVNRGTEDLEEMTVLIPYPKRYVDVYYARIEGWETSKIEEYVDEKGNIHDIKTFDDAVANAGLADFSAIDVEEKAVNGLVYAVIKYPYNQTKNELVYGSVYKDYALKYGGWDNVPMWLVQDLSINVKKRVREEKRFVEKDIPTKLDEKYGQTTLHLDFPYSIGPDDNAKITLRYKVLNKITSSGLRDTAFTMSFAIPENTFNAVISVMVPKHDVFKFTKPEHDLERIKDYGQTKKRPVRVETYSNMRFAPSASMAPMFKASEAAEDRMIEEESKAGEQTYFENNRVYRLMLFDITPDEKFAIEGFYADNERYYGTIFASALMILGIIVAFTGKKIKRYVW